MRRKTRLRGAVIFGMMVGLLLLLALPTAGLAIVALQATDEEPRKLNAHDAALGAPGPGQRTAAQAAAFDPNSAPGALVSAGSGTQPTGSFRLLTYVLEEVPLPAGVPIPALGGRSDLPSVWRLSVLGGPFPVRAMPPVIWIDDLPLKQVAISPDLTRLSVLLPDRSVLRNGATISVSYGEAAEQRQRLTETFTLGSGSP